MLILYMRDLGLREAEPKHTHEVIELGVLCMACRAPKRVLHKDTSFTGPTYCNEKKEIFDNKKLKR